MSDRNTLNCSVVALASSYMDTSKTSAATSAYTKRSRDEAAWTRSEELASSVFCKKSRSFGALRKSQLFRITWFVSVMSGVWRRGRRSEGESLLMEKETKEAEWWMMEASQAQSGASEEERRGRMWVWTRSNRLK